MNTWIKGANEKLTELYGHHPDYYPTYGLDYFWCIVSLNKGAKNWAPSSAELEGKHFFEMLLDPKLGMKSLLHSTADWQEQILRAMRYFHHLVKPETPAEQQIYTHLIENRLAVLEGFSDLYEQARSLGAPSPLPMPSHPVEVCHIYIACPFAQNITLELKSTVRLSPSGSRDRGEEYYEHALYPADKVTHVALNLMSIYNMNYLRDGRYSMFDLSAMYDDMDEQGRSDPEEGLIGDTLIPTREQDMKNVEAVAVRFSKNDTPRGWKTLDTLVGSLYVSQIAGGLTYILSSTHWSEVEQALKASQIPYEYKRAAGYSKQTLEEPLAWTAVSLGHI